MTYEKPWKSYEDQLNQLIQRGLIVTDRTKALEYLERIGYYRLSGYWFPFRERSGTCCPLIAPIGRKKFKRGDTDQFVLDAFKEGASFQNTVDLYVFDKKLRLLIMDALERIEIGLRVDISHSLGKQDAFAYLKPDLLSNGFAKKLQEKTGLTQHHEWLTKQSALIIRSKEEFITHNKAKYGFPLPIWVVCEVWDFGAMSRLFAGMKEVDQDAIAKKYGVSNGRIFASWLRSLNYLRNVCAHHSRLWNRNIIDQPKLSPLGEVIWVDRFDGNPPHSFARPFLLLCITKHLLGIINPCSEWGKRLKRLLLEFPDLQHLGLNLAGMGVIEGWEHWDW
jgi:abortive infection bacteriophage resistance protein